MEKSKNSSQALVSPSQCYFPSIVLKTSPGSSWRLGQGVSTVISRGGTCSRCVSTCFEELTVIVEYPRAVCAACVWNAAAFFNPLPNCALRLPFLNVVLSGDSCSFQGAEIWEWGRNNPLGRKIIPFFSRTCARAAWGITAAPSFSTG